MKFALAYQGPMTNDSKHLLLSRFSRVSFLVGMITMKVLLSNNPCHFYYTTIPSFMNLCFTCISLTSLFFQFCFSSQFCFRQTVFTQACLFGQYLVKHDFAKNYYHKSVCITLFPPTCSYFTRVFRFTCSKNCNSAHSSIFGVFRFICSNKNNRPPIQ